jgi:hypothetical protein
MKNKLFIFFLLLGGVTPVASALLPTEIDKILFMIFENQNKKIIYEKKVVCKKPPQDWICGNQTAKQFLMNVYRTKSTNPFVLKTEIICQEITPDLQKNIENETEAYYGALEFRREVRQSLKGQWLCRFQAEQNLISGVENFDDKSQFLLGADGSAKNKIGFSFIMNRDKNRIVSRKFAGWTAAAGS